MRSLNKKCIDNQLTNTDLFSIAFNTDQTFACSAQLEATGSVLGNFKLQVSDDAAIAGNPQNWSDIPNSSIAINGAGIYFIEKTDISGQFHRVTFIDTSEGTNTGSITVNLFTHGF